MIIIVVPLGERRGGTKLPAIANLLLATMMPEGISSLHYGGYIYV